MENSTWARLYRAHKFNSEYRGIQFLLTFEDWLKIWIDSGYLNQRGKGRDKYCMARLGDVGPYAVENVKIITNGANRAEQIPSEEVRRNQSNFMAGNTLAKNPPQHVRAALALAAKGNKHRIGKTHSAEAKAKIGAKSKNRKFTIRSRAKMRASALASNNAGRFTIGHQEAELTKQKKSETKKAQWADPTYRAMMLTARKPK